MVVLASLGVAACGSASSGSSDPNTVLKQTFSGTHKVTSGKLNLSLTVDPSGSSIAERADHAELRRPVPDARHRQAP